jgi:crotonobetainyl-CoA:carnitine CoA-transferase CaiB-like acyl-CoA transferase
VNGVLEGLRILDLTTAFAGPFCTQVFADHGADVVKIEPPGGDATRRAGPWHKTDTSKRHSGYFHSVNRNKRGMVLDLKSDAGKAVLRQMVPQFDVVIENFRAGVMERLELSYESLKELNPKLVYASIRGFGDPHTADSPYIDWPAFDVVAQAMGGVMGVTGPDAHTPTKVGPGIGDSIPALYCAIGILGAVLRARETGQGQYVDVAMVDGILAVCERMVYQLSVGEVVAKPEGNHHPFLVPFGVFPASDGQAAIACPDDDFFGQLGTLLDAPDFVADVRFATTQQRMANRLDCIAAMSAITARFSKAELKARLGGKVPFGPVYNMAEIATDPHFAARKMLVNIDCPGLADPVQITGTPIRFSETPGGVRHCGPDLGQHSDEILAEAGFRKQAISELRASGAVK